MSKLPDLPTYSYTVHRLVPSTGGEESVLLEAAYFQEQGALLLFKDAAHVAVGAFRLELVTEVMRSDEPVE